MLSRKAQLQWMESALPWHRIEGTHVEIAIIPHTYRSTNLHSLLAGTEVNIEVDVLSKYAAQRHIASTSDKWSEHAPILTTWSARPQTSHPVQLAPEQRDAMTVEYLLANGY